MELIDALHLRGWRGVTLAVLVCGGAAVGALRPRDASFTSQHILFAAQVAPQDLNPAQVEDFGDELRLAANLPGVQAAVQEQVPGEYVIALERTTSASSIRISTEADTAEVAQAASRLTGVEAVRFVLGQSIARTEALSAALGEQFQAIRSEQATIVGQAGGIDPVIALDRASELLFDARQDLAAGDVEAAAAADALEDEIATLQPLAQRADELALEAVQVSGQMSDAAGALSQARTALDNAETPAVIAEVNTGQKSQVPAQVQGALMIAIINGLVFMIPLTILDRVADARARRKAARVDTQQARGDLDARHRERRPDAPVSLDSSPPAVSDNDHDKTVVATPGPSHATESADNSQTMRRDVDSQTVTPRGAVERPHRTGQPDRKPAPAPTHPTKLSPSERIGRGELNTGARGAGSDRAGGSGAATNGRRGKGSRVGNGAGRSPGSVGR